MDYRKSADQVTALDNFLDISTRLTGMVGRFTTTVDRVEVTFILMGL